MIHRTLPAVLASLVVGSALAFAQGLVCQLGPGGAPYNAFADQPATAYANNELGQIAATVCPNGCGSVMLVQNASVPNAMTFSVGPGTSKIAYNPYFMNGILAQIGPQASFGILAHEFGHHLDLLSPAAWMDSSWGRELRADAWAGCVLAKSGLQTQQISIAVQAIASYPSPSHPGWPQRLAAVKSGYQNCGGSSW